MSNTDADLERQVESIRDSLNLLVKVANKEDVQAADVSAEFGYTLTTPDTDTYEDGDEYDKEDAAEIARDILNEWPLEIVVHGTKGLGDREWSVTGLRVVFTIGGPHIELNTQTGAIEGSWAGSVVRRYVSTYAQAFYDNLEETTF